LSSMMNREEMIPGCGEVSWEPERPGLL
jgi:hypothetical protein